MPKVPGGFKASLRFLMGEVPLYALAPIPSLRTSHICHFRALDRVCSSLLLSSLESSDTKVYEPEIRALLGTALHFFKVLVLKLITVLERVAKRRFNRGEYS